MAESESGADTSNSVPNKWPGYCKTFLVKEPNGNIKELVFPKALDLDRPKRDRTTFSSRQLKQLEDEFMCNQYVVGKDRTRLAKSLGLTETQVKVWFQNRRTKLKKDNERKDSETDPQAESKAAQNVLKLLSLRTSAGYPNFQSKQTTPQPQAEDAEAQSSPQKMTASPEFSKFGLTKGDVFIVAGFTDAYSGGFKGVSMAGNFPQTVPGIEIVPHAPIQVNDAVMNQSRANCQFPVSAIPSFGTKNESKNQMEQQPEIGPMMVPEGMVNRPTDNPVLYHNSGERSSYFGQGEVFLPQFTGLPSWLGDYQRLNILRHSSTHWHQNQHQTSHFGAQQTLARSMGVHAYQNKNVYGEVHPAGQWLHQMSAVPAGYVWRYMHPAHVKQLEFQNQSNDIEM